MKPLNFILYFCNFVKQQERYKPKHLPYGKYLHGNGYLANLQKVFEYFIKDVDRLLNMGSTQDNKSFNSIVASKHPKKNRFVGVLSQWLLDWQQLCLKKTLDMMPFLRFVDFLVCSYVYVYKYS